MIGRPPESEAPSHFQRYIRLVDGDDVVAILEEQLDEAWSFFLTLSDEASQHCFVTGKWSLGQTLNHMTDTERVFAYRALWFARGLGAELPGFDQDVGAANAGADGVSWSTHVEEFRRVRLSTLSLFKNLPPEAWERSGSADGNAMTVRALCYVIAGHFAHHFDTVRRRYSVHDATGISSLKA